MAITRDEFELDPRFGGEDLYYEIAGPDVELGEADYVITADGDFATVSGREALRQSLVRRMITNPGEWQTKPEYGAGARQYVKARNTPEARAELEGRIRAQCLLDPRVERVESIIMSNLDDIDGLQISIFVVPRGRLRGDSALPVKLTVR